MRYLNILLSLLLMLLAVACGNNDEFVIKCNIKGLGEKGVEMIYADRTLKRVNFHPVDGKVTLKGIAVEPTLIDVFTVDGELLFSCVASNGDEFEVNMDLDAPGKIEFKGNDEMSRYGKFVTANDSILRKAGQDAVNSLIAREIRSNPSHVSSALLLATCFQARGHELLADSLINELEPEARPDGVIRAFASLVGEQLVPSVRAAVKTMTLRAAPDTVVRFVPSMQSYSLLAFVGTHKPDSIRKVLRELNKKLHKRRFTELELTVTSDSATWAGAIRNDSAKWVQAWLPGGVANGAIRGLQVPFVPYFIVTDSLGHQLYRGASLSAASDTVKRRLEIYFRPEHPADSVGK